MGAKKSAQGMEGKVLGSMDDDVLFYSGIGNKRIDHEIPCKGACDKLPDKGV